MPKALDVLLAIRELLQQRATLLPDVYRVQAKLSAAMGIGRENVPGTVDINKAELKNVPGKMGSF